MKLIYIDKTAIDLEYFTPKSFINALGKFSPYKSGKILIVISKRSWLDCNH